MLNAAGFMKELERQQSQDEVQAEIERIITRKCEIRRELGELERRQSALIEKKNKV